MKQYFQVFLSVLLLLAGAAGAQAADELTLQLQKGLLEEEANRNYEAALKAYQAAVAAYDTNRQAAATAVFRLAEVYRKLGKTNEAWVQYERVIAEFSDQTNLVNLSRVQIPASGFMRVSSNTTNFQERLRQIVEQSANSRDTNSGFSKQLKRILERQANPDAPQIPAEEENEIERLQLLLKNSPDLINAKTGESNRTPLQTAAAKGQTYVAKFLLNNGARVNLKVSFSPLSLAAENGHKAMVELLLESGADLEAKESNGRTALHRAVEKGNFSVVELLLNKGAQIDAQDSNGYVPLHTAVRNEDMEMVKLLIARKAALNVQFALLGSMGSTFEEPISRNGTPLHLAAAKGFTQIIKQLVFAGAEVDARDDWGQTPVFLAARIGNKEAVEFLLEQKADPNITSKADGTPLRVTKSPQVAEALLRAGANVNAENQQKLTALSMAVNYGNKDLVAVLLRHHAATEPASKMIESPLIKAVNNDSQEIARMLLEAKADPNWEMQFLNSNEIKSLSPLYVAVGNRKADLAKLLLSYKANITITKTDGETLLHMAVRNRDIPMVKLLLEHGADVNAVTKAGLTPYIYAGTPVNSAGQPLLDERPESVQELRRLLEEKGADKFYYRRSRILMSRKSKGLEKEFFQQDARKANHWSLFELILKCYADHEGNRDFAFPDFSKITISRLTGNQTTNIAVNVATDLELGNTKADLWLEPGDLVEIPEVDHKLAERWTGLAEAISLTLNKSCARSVTLVVKDNSNVIRLARSPIRMARGISEFPSAPPVPSRPVNPATITTVQTFLPSFNLSDVAFDSKALLSSSDTKRVKVIRKSPNSSEKVEMIYDIGAIRNSVNDLWLRDGDVIEIPERETDK